MNTIRQYNKRRIDYIPIKEQYTLIKQYFGKKLLSVQLDKEDKNYITIIVRV